MGEVYRFIATLFCLLLTIPAWGQSNRGNSAGPNVSNAATYALLRSSINPTANAIACTSGYTTAGDGGQGCYSWLAGDATSPNQITIVSSTYPGALGNWHLVGDTLDAQQAGAKCDGSTDDTAALQAWVNVLIATGMEGRVSAVTCMHTGLTIDVSGGTPNANHSGIVIRGNGTGQSVLKLIAGSTNNSITYTGAANYGNQSRSVFSNFTIDGSYPTTSTGDGVHLADLAGGGYPQGITFDHVTIKFAANDGLYIGANENNGRSYDLSISHSGLNGVEIRAGDWIFNSSEFYGSDQAGLPITNAVNNGSGLVRLTVAGHGLTTNQQVAVYGVSGATGSLGLFLVTVIDANTLDLQGSTFGGTYTSGGRALPIFSVASAVSDGGLIKIGTSQAHGYTTGQQVRLVGLGGTVHTAGVWKITVIDSTHFDLIGSTFSGSYTSGGTVNAISLGVRAIAPTQFNQSRSYSNTMGFDVTSNSGDGVAVVGGEYNGNYMGGFEFASLGNKQPNVIDGGTLLAGNSLLQEATYPDIYFADTGQEVVADNFFYKSGNHSSYLIQADAQVNSFITFANNAMCTIGSCVPWGTAIASDASGNAQFPPAPPTTPSPAFPAFNSFFCNGADGALNVSSGTTTLSTRDECYSSLTVSGTGSIVAPGVRIFVSGLCDFSAAPAAALVAAILSAGGNASGATKGNGGTAPGSRANQGGQAGANGGTGDTAGGTGPASITNYTYSNGGNGGAGGVGGASGSAGQAGGTGGSAATHIPFVNPVPLPQIAGSAATSVAIGSGQGGGGGGAGRGDGVNAGGGGGGGGPGQARIWLACQTINRGGSTAVGAIQAIGGVGGNGAAGVGGAAGGGAGGGGGGGGDVVIVYQNLLGATATNMIDVSGGNGGNGGNGLTTGIGGTGGTGGSSGNVTFIQVGTPGSTTIGSTNAVAGSAATVASTTAGTTGGTGGASKVNF